MRLFLFLPARSTTVFWYIHHTGAYMLDGHAVDLPSKRGCHPLPGTQSSFRLSCSNNLSQQFSNKFDSRRWLYTQTSSRSILNIISFISNQLTTFTHWLSDVVNSADQIYCASRFHQGVERLINSLKNKKEKKRNESCQLPAWTCRIIYSPAIHSKVNHPNDFAYTGSQYNLILEIFVKLSWKKFCQFDIVVIED